MPKQMEDGSVLYEYPDSYTDVFVDGRSVANHNPISARIWPGNYGWVHLFAAPNILTSDARTVKQGSFEKEYAVDGQPKTYFVQGMVSVEVIQVDDSEPASAIASTFAIIP